MNEYFSEALQLSFGREKRLRETVSDLAQALGTAKLAAETNAREAERLRVELRKAKATLALVGRVADREGK